jgi:transposase
MPHYAALDVSNEETAIHILDETGTTVWRGKRASDPEVLATALRRHAPELVRVGLETGPLTPWLYHTLKSLGLPVICLDARHARAATALQRNKTDARDAETLAHIRWPRDPLSLDLQHAIKQQPTCADARQTPPDRVAF